MVTGEAIWEGLVVSPAHRLRGFIVLLRRTALACLYHDVLTVAQATAYSAMVALFPALIVAAAAIALLPDSLPLRSQMALFFDRILPSNVSPLLQAYFVTTHRSPQTASALLGSVVVSATGAANVMATLMEGFRRAHHLAAPPGSFWTRRGRALILVPLSLVPLLFSSVLVVFGHFITVKLAEDVTPSLQGPVYAIALVLRWTVALAGSVGIIAVIYHLGTDLRTHVREHIEPMLREPWVMLRRDWSWRASLPGATLATFLWFLTTLLFGLYVTRYANYGQVYGSLGAAIALMFWLYIIALSVLVGAEYNAQRAAVRRGAPEIAPSWKLPPHDVLADR